MAEEHKENGGVEATALAAAAAEIEELPKTIVRRVVKEKLSQLSPNSDLSVLREAQQAFCESARIFIHYLSATANDVCKDSKRQIINAEDVFKALDEMEFTEFIEPLRDNLEEFRQKNSRKKAKLTKESNGVVEEKETLEDDEHDANISIKELMKKNGVKKSALTKDSKEKSTSAGKSKRKEDPSPTDKEEENPTAVMGR